MSGGGVPGRGGPCAQILRQTGAWELEESMWSGEEQEREGWRQGQGFAQEAGGMG